MCLCVDCGVFLRKGVRGLLVGLQWLQATCSVSIQLLRAEDLSSTSVPHDLC